MSTFSRCIYFLLLTLLAITINGCGGGGGTASTPVDTSSVQKGAVVQGPVLGATVFADNVASGIRFVQDAGEISAQTDAAGNYFLPAFPSYDFVLVSTGGTDTITNQPALLLIAPAGSSHITALTTLVALDTTKTVQAKLEALMGGTKFDTNVSTNASPAVLMLIKAAETTVQSVNDAVKQAAANAGKTVDQKQLNFIQAQTWFQIALAFAGTTQNLATPAGLAAALTTAVEKALTAIKAEPANSNISSITASAATIADTSVDAALLALGMGVTHTSPAALSTTTVRTESSLASPATVFSTALNTLKTAYSVVITASTPNPYSPQPLQVVTTTSTAIILIITGASGGTAGIGLTF